MAGKEIKVSKEAINRHAGKILKGKGNLRSNVVAGAGIGITNYKTYIMATDDRSSLDEGLLSFTEKLEKSCGNLNKMADAYETMDKSMASGISSSGRVNKSTHRSRK